MSQELGIAEREGQNLADMVTRSGEFHARAYIVSTVKYVAKSTESGVRDEIYRRAKQFFDGDAKWSGREVVRMMFEVVYGPEER